MGIWPYLAGAVGFRGRELVHRPPPAFSLFGLSLALGCKNSRGLMELDRRGKVTHLDSEKMLCVFKR